MSQVYTVAYSTEKRLLFAVALEVRRFFGFEVRLSCLAKKPKVKLFATELIQELKKHYSPSMLRLVALFDGEVYQEGVGFVKSVSELGGVCVVVSVSRKHHRSERELFEEVLSQVRHALEHTFGSLECSAKECRIREVSKDGFFCERCSRIILNSLKEVCYGNHKL